MVGLLSDIDGFKATSEHFAGLFEQLPAQVAKERSAVFNEVSALVARERSAVLTAFDQRESSLRGIIGDLQTTLDKVDASFGRLRQTTADAQHLLAGTEKTALVLKDLIGSVDHLAARFESKTAETPAEPFEINDYTEVLAQAERTLQKLNDLMTSVDRTTTPLITSALDEFDRSVKERIDHIFWRLIELVAATAVLVLLVVIVHHRLRRRQTSGPERGIPD
jgi:methyl-accepting chemotaxis protein